MWPYVLLGIFLLIGLILYSPLVLKVQYEEKLSVWLRFWFIKVTLLPKKEKPVKKKNLKKSQKKRKPQSAADVKSQPAKKSGWQNLVEQHGVVGAIEQIASVFLLLPKSVKRLMKGATVRGMDLQIAVAGEDAAQAAITYGRVCSVFYPLLGRASAYVNFVRPRVNLYCDYEATASVIKGKAGLYIPLYRGLGTGLYILKELIKKNLKNKGGNQHERTKNS
jgi:hypothetical protein